VYGGIFGGAGPPESAKFRRRESIESKLNELTFEIIGEEMASQLFSAIERLDMTTRVADIMRFVRR